MVRRYDSSAAVFYFSCCQVKHVLRPTSVVRRGMTTLRSGDTGLIQLSRREQSNGPVEEADAQAIAEPVGETTRTTGTRSASTRTATIRGGSVASDRPRRGAAGAE